MSRFAWIVALFAAFAPIDRAQAETAVEKEKVTFASIKSGGSFASVSETWSPLTVTVQVVSYGSADVGVRETLAAGPPLCVNDWENVAGQSMENAAGLAVTLSLK